MGVFDDDITNILTDLDGVDGSEVVDVVIAGTTVDGIVDVLETADEGGLTVKRNQKSVVIKKGGLSSLASKVAITVGGNAGFVHDYEPEGEDDRMTRILYVET
ncbi:hypothetical protein LCGC14_2997470 [marine sediment metagenome]|uniref:Uncharacterized protein n=1 Tax=marine sediment metagenome TaxID=412755 RepID=A0A0F8X2H6_9ZZZZ